MMESALKQKIIDSIGGITDKDLGKTLNELNAIKEVVVTDEAVQVVIELIQPIHVAYNSVKKEISAMLDELAPGLTKEIFIEEAPFQRANPHVLPGVKNLIAVSSGKGGVGKSAITANLAAAISLTGATVGVIDADIYGPSQPTMFGLSDERLNAMQAEDGKTVAIPNERYGIKIASMGFMMNKQEAAIVRGPMLAGYFSMMFEQVEWGELDYIIFDLPPGTGDIQLTLVQKIPLTGGVVVTTPQEIALADVRRAIAMFNRVNVDILGIVENMSYFTPPDMPEKKYYIFGKGGGAKMADEYNTELLGEVPLDPAMREGNDGGLPVVLDPDGGAQSDVLKYIAGNVIRSVRQVNYSRAGGPEIAI